MDRDNQTMVTEFLLLGLSGQSEQEEVLFGLFLWMYLVTIIGNVLIVLAISCDRHLHTPMYFFLANLSCVDICFSSVTTPKMLLNHMVGSKSISYVECMTQIYFFITFINMDGFLLSVMAYDRYVAICCPLHYSIIMKPKLCVLLVAASWVITNLHALLHTLLMVQLTFYMDGDNQTMVTEFLLLGLSGQSEQEEVLFGLFLWMYLVTIIGNVLIVLAISCDRHLHTPMYFFLANLSCVDICFSSVTTPKMLLNHMVGSKSISYVECMTQIYFFITFINMDGFLLSVMAYDRYVAICCPLHYSIIMKPKLCVLLVAASWVITNLHALLHTLLMVQLTFCFNNTMHHFFCDPYAVLKLSCSDTFINDLMVFTVGGLIFLTPFTCIIISYAYILSNVLKLPSAHGIRKALSTCGSHLT
ncbi:OR1G1 protein, partial [Crocuta crocuta]